MVIDNKSFPKNSTMNQQQGIKLSYIKMQMYKNGTF